jgi:hypothetical protein
MRTDRDDRDAATYHEGTWVCHASNRSFNVMWAEHEALLRCEDPATGQSATLGPFDMIGMLNHTIHVNREHSRDVARLDETTRKWIILESGLSWPQLVILPAPAPTFRIEHIWPAIHGE